MTDFNKSKWQTFKENFINSFKLTTQRITLIGIFLALTTLISLFEIPTFFNSFLTVDFANTINLLAVFVIKLPYGLLIAIIFPWLRLIIPHTIAPNVIGEFANMLSSISVLLIYFGLKMLVSLINYNKNNWKLFWLIESLICVICVLAISLLNTFYNWAFILDLYGTPQFKSVLWTLFLPYNLFKFTLVFLLFLLLQKPLLILKDHFNQ